MYYHILIYPISIVFIMDKLDSYQAKVIFKYVSDK